MTGASAVALLLSLYAIWWMYQHQASCARCHGRGRHRRGCPFDANGDDRG
jgi:hypothetical protein